jgi:hypothetical protein
MPSHPSHFLGVVSGKNRVEYSLWCLVLQGVREIYPDSSSFFGLGIEGLLLTIIKDDLVMIGSLFSPYSL